MSKLIKYVFVIVLLCAACVGISVYLINCSSVDTVLKIPIMVLIALCLCIYTTFEITRHIASSMKKAIQELNDVSAYLNEASDKMRDTADELAKNAVLLVKHLESAAKEEISSTTMSKAPFDE